MLRGLLLLLLALNLLFAAWTQGWLGAAWPPPGQSEREPERLATQISPERMVVLTPQAAAVATLSARQGGAGAPASAPAADTVDTATLATAPAAGPATAAAVPLCLEAGPFNAEQWAAASRVLAQLGLAPSALERLSVNKPQWLVFAGRFADANARRTRLQAWQRQGVPLPELFDGPRELTPGLVFSSHGSEAQALAALAALAQRYPAVANVARVVQGPAPGGNQAPALLRVRTSSAELASRLRDVALPQQARMGACSAPN